MYCKSNGILGSVTGKFTDIYWNIERFVCGIWQQVCLCSYYLLNELNFWRWSDNKCASPDTSHMQTHEQRDFKQLHTQQRLIQSTSLICALLLKHQSSKCAPLHSNLLNQVSSINRSPDAANLAHLSNTDTINHMSMRANAPNHSFAQRRQIPLFTLREGLTTVSDGRPVPITAETNRITLKANTSSFNQQQFAGSSIWTANSY